MRAVSARRARRDAGYGEARRQVWDRSDGLCEIRLARDCTGRCEQVHHIAGRGGPNPHDLGNLAGCCQPCHGWVHSYPAQAQLAGWMRSRHTVSNP